MKKKPVLILMMAPLLVMIWCVVAGCSRANQEAVAWMIIHKGGFEVVIPGFGELQSIKSTPITLPAQIQGDQTIAWMAPENTVLRKGEIVARLDDSWYRDNIQQEEFNIAKLNLEIKDKEQQMDKEKSQLFGQLNLTTIEKEISDLYAARDESLYAKNKIIEDAISLDYLKEKTTHLQQKKSKLERKALAEMQLLELKRRTYQMKIAQYKEALESLEIKAPHDGLFIYEKNWRGEKVSVGMSVWAGQKLGKFPDLSAMEAKLFILESEAGGLKPELSVSLATDSRPEKSFAGKVISIDTIAKPLQQDSPLKYFEVKVSLDKTDLSLMKPGTQVKASIFVQQLQDVFSIPNQALFFEQNNGKELSFVNVSRSSKIEKREVKIGVRSLTRTVITQGLSEGEEILLGNPL